MNATAENLSKTLRQAFLTFWDENLLIENREKGAVLSPPLMLASGWQVIVRLEPLTPGKWELSDDGKTLGLNLQSAPKAFKQRLEEFCRFYALEQDGFLLKKVISEPLNPVDIQVFSEALVAVSHLVAFHAPQAVGLPVNQVVEDRVSTYFHARNRQPQRKHKLSGKVDRDIVVDFYLENGRPIAVETVRRAKNILPYMEQWGYRWLDLKAAYPDMVRAMVFDPDSQRWDDNSLRIGRDVCDVFVPYTETDALDQYLTG